MVANWLSPDWDFFGVVGWLRFVLVFCLVVLVPAAVCGLVLQVAWLREGDDK